MQFHSLLLLSTGWNQFIQVFAALSLLILLHEFGHFFFARLFKTRVERFYLFFDFLFPFPGLLNFSLFKKKKGDTEYGLGWFPLGGYVKIAGMVDESMDKEQMAKPPEPWEYRSKPAWQRLFIMLGGIIVNVLTAMIIYMVIFGVYGEDYLATQTVNAQTGIAVDSVGQSIGLRSGDKIVSVGGRKVERFHKIIPEIIFSEASFLEVERNGATVSVPIPAGTVRAMTKKRMRLFDARVPIVVNEILKGSAAEKMGLKMGDSIIKINNQPIRFYDELEGVKQGMSDGQPITLDVMREGTAFTRLSGTLGKDKSIGFGVNRELERYYKFNHISYSPGEAIAKGFSFTWTQFGYYAQQLKLLFVSKEIKLSENIGGLLSFGKSAPPELDMHDFLWYTAFISIILAFMNLLPIPGLDGGYVFFLLWELITRRKVSDKVMERATTVGLVLLLGLMLYANGMDVFREFIKR